MREMEGSPSWYCDWLDSRPESPRDLDQWTVGDIFELSCRGEPLEQALQKDAQLVFAQPEETYSLHVLEVIDSELTHVRMWVTAYKPGSHRPESLVLRDSQGRMVSLEPLAWEVQSVWTEQEMPQPHPPFGPYLLAVPLSYWASWALVVSLFLALFFWRWFKWSQRRQWRRELEQQGRALGPYLLFHKELRALRRRGRVSGQAVAELRESFWTYLARRMLVPAHRWSLGATLRELKRQNRKAFRERGGALRALSQELQRASRLEKPDPKDFDQLMQLCSQEVDQLERLFSENKPQVTGRGRTSPQ